jgi:hypothetical protein
VQGGGRANISTSLQIASNGVVNVTGGFLTLGATNPAAGAGALQVNAGGQLSGSGSIEGEVFNTGGAVSAGNPLGTLTIAGNYSQSDDGVLNIALGGTNSGQSGQLAVSGSAALGGALNIVLTNGFAPLPGAKLEILSASGVSGTFASTNLAPGLSLIYSNAAVYVAVTGPVPPQLANPQIAGGNIMFDLATLNDQTYTVQENTILETTNWTFFTNIIGNGSVQQVIAPATEGPQKFFRVLEQ